MNRTVVIALNNTLKANSLCSVFTKLSYSVILCQQNVDEIMTALNLPTPPIVLLVDADFDGQRGFEIARKAKIRISTLKCLVILSSFKVYLEEALRVDINGYVTPEVSEAELEHALQVVQAGYRYIAPTILKHLNLPVYHAQYQAYQILSKRELEILQLLTEGKTSQQVAEQLFIEKCTVDNHKQRMTEKLGLKSRRELVYYYISYVKNIM